VLTAFALAIGRPPESTPAASSRCPPPSGELAAGGRIAMPCPCCR